MGPQRRFKWKMRNEWKRMSCEADGKRRATWSRENVGPGNICELGEDRWLGSGSPNVTQNLSSYLDRPIRIRVNPVWSRIYGSRFWSTFHIQTQILSYLSFQTMTAIRQCVLPIFLLIENKNKKYRERWLLENRNIEKKGWFIPSSYSVWMG